MVKYDTVIICMCFFCARVWCWKCYGDKCYYRSTQKMNWSTGVSYCGYIYSTIASIHSYSENQYVHIYVCGGNNCWIGLNDKYYEGRFRWADGTPVDYTRWDSGEPNDWKGEDMAYMRSAGDWNDDEEWQSHYVICMKPRPTPSPTREPSYPWPTCQPTTIAPTKPPSPNPTTNGPTMVPTLPPTYRPSALPSLEPTYPPSVLPTSGPTNPPSHSPTIVPSSGPTTVPSIDPTPYPSVLPTSGPTHPPSHPPTIVPSSRPTPVPSINPTYPSVSPSLSPTLFPSDSPTLQPTALPSVSPTNSSVAPSAQPSIQPTTQAPTLHQSESPTSSPTAPTYPNSEYCIERGKLHFASIVLACLTICTLCIFLLRRSTRNLVSPKIFSPEIFSPKRFRIERIGVQSKPEQISTISMKDLGFESISERGEGIPEFEEGETLMTPV